MWQRRRRRSRASTSEDCWQPAEAGGRPGEDSPQSLQKGPTCRHLDFGHLASGTVRECILRVVICSGSPRNQTHHPFCPSVNPLLCQASEPHPTLKTFVKATRDGLDAKADGQFSASTALDLASPCPSGSPLFMRCPGHYSPLEPHSHSVSSPLQPPYPEIQTWPSAQPQPCPLTPWVISSGGSVLNRPAVGDCPSDLDPDL